MGVVKPISAAERSTTTSETHPFADANWQHDRTARGDRAQRHEVRRRPLQGPMRRSRQFSGTVSEGRERAVQRAYPSRPRCRQIDGTVRPPKVWMAESSYGGGKLTPPAIPGLGLRDGGRFAPPRWCRFGTTGGLSRGCRIDTPIAEPRPGTSVQPSPADLRWLRFHTAAARSWTCGAVRYLSTRRRARLH